MLSEVGMDEKGFLEFLEFRKAKAGTHPVPPKMTLEKFVDEFEGELSNRLRNILYNYSASKPGLTIEQMLENPRELLKMRNMGAKSYRALIEFFELKGYTFNKEKLQWS